MTVNDPANGIVYFASSTYELHGTISRVFAGNWTEWSTITTDDAILSGVIDGGGGYVYFGTLLGTVLKLAAGHPGNCSN